MTHTLTLNGKAYPLPLASLPLPDLLSTLNATTPGHAVALNGRVVPRSQWYRTTVSADDSLVVIQPIAGG